MTAKAPAADDRNDNTAELTIAPDGRVFVFGTSRPILEVLESLQPQDQRLRRLLAHVRALEQQERSDS